MVARNKRAENTGKKERREAEYGEAVGLLCPHSLPFSISYKKKKFQNTPASSSPTSPSFGHPPYRTSFFLLITEGQVVMRARRREEQERTRGLVQEGEMRGTKREKEKKKKHI